MNMEKEIKILNIDDILPNRFQPRIQFSDKNINELADSIKEHGVIQPIVVRKISDKYEIIAGERRYKASILAGKTTIPAIVTDLDDKNSAEIALIENVQRQDLTPIEEAVSYKKILDMGYINQTELAEKLGKTQSTIANKLRLLNLDDEVQEALLDGKISERHARSLLRLNNKDQVNMLSRIINERLTVRKTDEEVEKMLNNEAIDTTDSGEQKKLDNESVGIKMNDEIKNEFNIPNNPIYQEEKPNVEPIESINPGFMDINKIENNAEDIFKPEEKVDLNSLLETKEEPKIETTSAMAPIPEEPIVPPAEEEKPKGKFFNMFNFTPREENPNYVENIEEKETNIDFGLPKKEENPFNPFSLSTPIENNQISSNDIPEPLNTSTDTINVENTQNSFNPFNLDSTTNQNDNYQSVNNELNSQIEDDSNEITLEPIQPEEELFSSVNVNPYHLNDDSEFTTKVPVEEINNVLNSQSESIPNSYESTKVDLPEPEEKYVTADFKTVINTIRECAATIEKYGYKVETEELDFEDSYQVNFKIEK